MSPPLRSRFAATEDFKTGAAFWMTAQARFDLETAEDVLAPQIKKIAAGEAV